MSLLDTGSVLRPVPDLRFRRIDDVAVVIRQRAGEVLVMNETAARLLELADGRTSVAGALVRRDIMVGGRRPWLLPAFLRVVHLPRN